jgi:hypothetical protein
MTIAGGRATNAVRSGGRSTTSYGRNSSREIDGRELVAELIEMGYEPEPQALTNLMLQLRAGGMVLFEAACSGNPESLWNIRLDVAGRWVVEAWPQESGRSAADVEALLAILDGRAEDPELSDAERKKWRAVAKALGDAGVGAAGGLCRRGRARWESPVLSLRPTVPFATIGAWQRDSPRRSRQLNPSCS